MAGTKVLFLGSHHRSCECLQYMLGNVSDIDVVAIVANRAEDGDYDRQTVEALAHKYKVPMFSLEDAVPLHYDLGISILYDRKLPAEMVDHPPRGFVNLHLGPLPRFRGVNSIYHAIRLARLHDNWMFGITLHYVDHGLDTGPIIDKLDIPIYPDDTAYDLYMRSTGKLFDLFVRNIGPLLSSKKRIPSTPQSGPSQYFKRSDIKLQIDLSWSPEEIYDAVRALTFPGKRKPYVVIGDWKIYLSLEES